jgi:hypothetical protein
MVLVHLCIACQHGDHAGHIQGQKAPPGVLGGWECPCTGNCKPPARWIAAEDVTPQAMMQPGVEGVQLNAEQWARVSDALHRKDPQDG